MSKGKANNTNNEPAEISYWFGPGWRQFGAFQKNIWAEIKRAIKGCYTRYIDHTILTIPGLFWLIASITVAVFSTIITAVVSALFTIVLALFYVGIYLGFTVVFIIDRLYLQRHRIFVACPKCKEKSLIPVYACPQCGAKHRNLTPGKYGIFHRKCECGAILGSTFFTGRKELKAYCPHCGEPLEDYENVPICIPVVGGRSVGKTAFITAFSKEFLDEVAPEHGWDTQFYNDEKKSIYEEIKNDYSHGTTRMTKRSNDVNTVSSVSFSFFLKGENLKPDRLVHIYDIAGEVFTQNSENEVQKQYEYCQGIVLMIDPYSIPEVMNRYGDQLSAEDRAGVGTADIEGIVDSFLNKLREVTGLSDQDMLNTPVAIVIGKADSPGLRNELGINRIKETMKQTGCQNEMDVLDYLCRDFLKRNDMNDFLTQISLRFRKSRYFACSSIGHSRDRGRYMPYGVIEPMEWLFGMADSEIRSQWHDHRFGRVPINVKEG